MRRPGHCHSHRFVVAPRRCCCRDTYTGPTWRSRREDDRRRRTDAVNFRAHAQRQAVRLQSERPGCPEARAMGRYAPQPSRRSSELRMRRRVDTDGRVDRCRRREYRRTRVQWWLTPAPGVDQVRYERIGTSHILQALLRGLEAHRALFRRATEVLQSQEHAQQRNE